MSAEKPLLLKTLRGEDPHLYTPEKKLVLWMNAAKGTHSYGRVMRIRGGLMAISIKYISIGLPGASSTLKDPLPEVSPLEVIDGLNGLLERYVMSPRLKELRVDGKRAQNPEPVRWFSQVLRSSFSPDEFRVEYQQKVLVTEGDVVRTLLFLAEEDQLHKLRTCEHCESRWLISIRGIDRFCSSFCRIQHRLKSDGSKERQRVNQRKYRKNLKEKMADEAKALSRYGELP